MAVQPTIRVEGTDLPLTMPIASFDPAEVPQLSAQLLDLGFEPQLRSLLQHEAMASAQERQTLLCCAHCSPALKRLLPGGEEACGLTRADLVTVHLGGPAALLAACDNSLVTQQVVFAEERDKQPALGKLVRASSGLTVVVCSSKRRCEMVAYLLQAERIAADEVAQLEKLKPREQKAALAAWAAGKVRVLLVSDAALLELVAPQLAPLGAEVAHVIGFDLPAAMAQYAERLQCTGRHGHTGRLSTLIGERESREALQLLLGVLREQEQEVPRWLDGQATLSHSAPPSEVTAGGW